MSGTSADSIDVAICTIEGTGLPTESSSGAVVTLEHFYTHSYPDGFTDCMRQIHQLTVKDISELHSAFGDIFAESCLAGIRKSGLSLDEIDLIGSHGQTIYHHSGIAGAVFCTLQLGDADRIAVRCKKPVFHDFRAKDIAVGGEGAPLTPYADAVFFGRGQLDNFAVLNLGGIANVSVFNPSFSKVIGFDVGPANAPLDRLAEKLSAGTLRCDQDGRFAAAGTVNQAILDKLFADDMYLKKSPPKSTGFEMYGDSFVEYLESLNGGLVDLNLLATATEFVAQSIGTSLKRFIPYELNRLVIAGGGKHNQHLVKRIRAAVDPIPLVYSDELGVPSDAREAMAFALLANEALFSTPSSLPSVTGASRAVSLGKLALPI
jgi:anhydro-N-acetylmuramic acid kinase